MKKTLSLLIFFVFIFAIPVSVYAQSKTTKYTYDALGRLTFVNDSVNGNRDYDYDKAGNRLLVTTGLASDEAAEPVTTLPAPTNLSRSLIASCAWEARWSAVSGADKYLVIDTSNAKQYVTTTTAYVACPIGNQDGNVPSTVQACNANNICGAKAKFN
ncbi:MAG: hypothetical protein IPK77_11710 [Cellvibrio sp.]|nr:hypothetical protein [Cellvibrio sp.]